jgi:hypothetical protein
MIEGAGISYGNLFNPNEFRPGLGVELWWP